MVSLILPTAIVNSQQTLVSDHSENDLVQALKAGDLKAFSRLYRNYSPALLGIISRIVINHENAEDLLQETFIKISKHIDRYDPDKGRLFTWMVRLARNNALDHLRSRSEINSGRNEELEPLTNKLDLKYNVSYNPETIGVRQLTGGLSDIQKTILDLIYFKGYTQLEAAQALNIPVGTIKTRVRHSILILRKQFN